MNAQELASKKAFVKRLADLLRHAMPDVEDLELNDIGTIVTISFINGYHKAVNVEANSYGTIIVDVTIKAMY